MDQHQTRPHPHTQTHPPPRPPHLPTLRNPSPTNTPRNRPHNPNHPRRRQHRRKPANTLPTMPRQKNKTRSQSREATPNISHPPPRRQTPRARLVTRKTKSKATHPSQPHPQAEALKGRGLSPTPRPAEAPQGIGARAAYGSGGWLCGVGFRRLCGVVAGVWGLVGVFWWVGEFVLSVVTVLSLPSISAGHTIKS